jgi:hypothetical protein
MGKQFDVVYDDFTGGHFMGPSQANQPRNTFTGPNVVCTADEGFLMPDGGWKKMTTAASTGLTTAPEITPPTVFGSSNTYQTNTRAEIWFVANGAPTLVRQVIPELDSVQTVATLPLGIQRQPVGSVLGNRISFHRGLSTNLLYLVTLGGTVTTATISADFTLGTFWWNNFAFGAGLGSNRLWFSAAGDPTSWPALNFIDVGESFSPIYAVVPTGDSLFIGKPDGWWTLTGVPGQSASLRRLSTTGHPAIKNTVIASPHIGRGAVHSNVGIVQRTIRGQLAEIVRGTQVEVFAHHSGVDKSKAIFVTTAGEYVVVTETDAASAGYDGTMWCYSESRGIWRQKAMPTKASQGAEGIMWIPVEDRAGDSERFYAVGLERYASTNHAIYVYSGFREPLDPQVDAYGYYDTATATLAEYSNTAPFTVKEMVVEVDFGQPAQQGAQRSVKASVVTQSVTDLDQTFDIAGDLAVPFRSTKLVKTWANANNTRRGHRQTVRFGVNDGAAATMTAAPVIEMTGVKVRRVILRCEMV